MVRSLNSVSSGEDGNDDGSRLGTSAAAVIKDTSSLESPREMPLATSLDTVEMEKWKAELKVVERTARALQIGVQQLFRKATLPPRCLI
jgi:hypothetical protein